MNRWLVITVILIVVFLTGCGGGGEKGADTDNLEILVNTESVHRTQIDRILKFSGILMPTGDAKLGTQLTSEVKNIYVKEGDIVPKGKTLATLSRANLDQASAQFEAVEAEWERIETLFDKGSVTRSQYDQAKAQYEATKAALTMAEDNTIIKAPFKGEILDVSAKEGQIFSPMMATQAGAPYIIHLVDDHLLKMEITVPDKQIALIKEGQRVRFHTDAIDSTLWGFVYSVTRAADHISGAFSATLHLENPEGIVPSGIYATAEVITETADSALVVPQDAMTGDSLLFKVEGKKARLVKARIGISNESHVQVFPTNGVALQDGDSVIVEGNIGMQDGKPVRIGRHITD